MLLASFVVELFHDFSDNLANRLDGFDIILRLGIIFLEVLEREPDCTNRESTTGRAERTWVPTVLEACADDLMLLYFLGGEM